MGKHRKYTYEALEPLVRTSYSIAEVCRKFGISDNGNMNTQLKRHIDILGIDYSHFQGRGANQGNRHKGGWRKNTWKDILVYNRMGDGRREKSHILKRAMLEYGIEYICAVCNHPPLWNKMELILPIDHKDGDPVNNRPDNVRFLCPNCHSQTDNFCGKNKGR